MLTKRLLTVAIVASAISSAPALAATEHTPNPAVLDSLKVIRQNADLIASGRVRGKAALQSPTREIAVAWAKIAPELSVNGDALVETKMTNASIATLERGWQSGSDVRDAAKDVSSNVADLTDAAAGH